MTLLLQEIAPPASRELAADDSAANAATIDVVAEVGGIPREGECAGIGGDRLVIREPLPRDRVRGRYVGEGRRERITLPCQNIGTAADNHRSLSRIAGKHVSDRNCAERRHKRRGEASKAIVRGDCNSLRRQNRRDPGPCIGYGRGRERNPKGRGKARQSIRLRRPLDRVAKPILRIVIDGLDLRGREDNALPRHDHAHPTAVGERLCAVLKIGQCHRLDGIASRRGRVCGCRGLRGAVHPKQDTIRANRLIEAASDHCPLAARNCQRPLGKSRSAAIRDCQSQLIGCIPAKGEPRSSSGIIVVRKVRLVRAVPVMTHPRNQRELSIVFVDVLHPRFVGAVVGEPIAAVE